MILATLRAGRFGSDCCFFLEASSSSQQARNIRRIKRASVDQFTVILTDLVNDDATRTQKLKVRDSLKHYFGTDIHILSYPQTLAVGEGHEGSELAKTHAKAHCYAARRCNSRAWLSRCHCRAALLRTG
jgi:hypothetical protein